MGKINDLVGRKFGKLLVIRMIDIRNHRAFWECSCDCGVVLEDGVCSSNLLREDGFGTRSCGCGRRKRPYESLYKQLLSVAKRREWKCLTYEEFLKFTKTKECHYCSDSLIWIEYRDRNYKGVRGYNLDRKDSSIGYLARNLVPCCKRCNLSKGDRFTYGEWVEIGRLIHKMRECVLVAAAGA